MPPPLPPPLLPPLPLELPPEELPDPPAAEPVDFFLEDDVVPFEEDVDLDAEPPALLADELVEDDEPPEGVIVAEGCVDRLPPAWPPWVLAPPAPACPLVVVAPPTMPIRASTWQRTVVFAALSRVPVSLTNTARSPRSTSTVRRLSGRPSQAWEGRYPESQALAIPSVTATMAATIPSRKPRGIRLFGDGTGRGVARSNDIREPRGHVGWIARASGRRPGSRRESARPVIDGSSKAGPGTRESERPCEGSGVGFTDFSTMDATRQGTPRLVGRRNPSRRRASRISSRALDIGDKPRRLGPAMLPPAPTSSSTMTNKSTLMIKRASRDGVDLTKMLMRTDVAAKFRPCRSK